MPTSLPSSLAQGLTELAALTEDQFAKLVQFLQSIPVEIKQYRVFNTPDTAIEGLPDGGQSIKEAAFSLLISRAAGRIPTDDFVDELCRTLSSSGIVETARLDTLRSRIVTILNISSLDLVARAHDVLLEHHQTFSSARTVTDVRPIFGNEVAQGPVGAVLVHMLSMVYYCAGSRNNFVLALDDKDVDALMEVLVRAKAKSEALRNTIQSSDLPYIKMV